MTTTKFALALLLALAAPLAAQAPTVSEQISVELVNVDVHVTARDGRPVVGLPRAAFRVTDDGEPVEISHFAWIPAVATAAHVAGDGAAGAVVGPRRIALFFDEIQVGERNREPLLAALRGELANGLGADDLVSVVRFDGANLDVLLDWTTDRRKLGRALDDLGGYSTGQLVAAQELRHWIGLLQSSIDDQVENCNNTGLYVRAYSDAIKRQVEASAGALLRYSYRLGAQPAPRVLLHLSGGLPMVAGEDVLQWAAEMCDGTALSAGVPGASAVIRDGPAVDQIRDRWNPNESRLSLAEYSNAELWHDVAARVNALGITIYPVLFGEIENRFSEEVRGRTMTATSAFNARQNARETLSLLAEATGGLMIDAVRDTQGELDRLVGDFGGYYSLAFTPSDAARAGVRRIRVELDREGVDLRFRESYRLQSRDERITLQLADLFEAERYENPLALAVDVHRLEGDEAPRLRVVVPFDRLSLIDSPTGGREGRFTVYVALRRESGRVLTPRQRSIVAQRADPNALAYTYEVVLPPGRGDVAVAIVDDYSGTVSFARERLVVR
ncbi:MAG TPA: VWA domain-containing protein [Thermoanaerobaculia bacterium]